LSLLVVLTGCASEKYTPCGQFMMNLPANGGQFFGYEACSEVTGRPIVSRGWRSLDGIDIEFGIGGFPKSHAPGVHARPMLRIAALDVADGDEFSFEGGTLEGATTTTFAGPEDTSAELVFGTVVVSSVTENGDELEIAAAWDLAWGEADPDEPWYRYTAVARIPLWAN
jgi:hypothetical protein